MTALEEIKIASIDKASADAHLTCLPTKLILKAVIDKN
jgi:hypothetical protein